MTNVDPVTCRVMVGSELARAELPAPVAMPDTQQATAARVAPQEALAARRVRPALMVPVRAE
jgi:hypothetical protein